VTLAEIVVDASVVVRGLTTEGPAAEVLDRLATGATVGHAPDLLIAEVSSALSVLVRADRRSLDDALSLLESTTRTPIELHPATPLAPAAVELAASSGLSAYDSFYAVLARALEISLVTADRRLASAVPGAMLVA
jgi:predicted nucleic acid-binding protein